MNTTKTPAKQSPAPKSDDQTPPQEFISRRNLAKRWDKSIEFIKHKERTGELHPTKLGYRSVAYRLSEIIEFENKMTS
jgi:hypothetical protein